VKSIVTVNQYCSKLYSVRNVYGATWN